MIPGFGGHLVSESVLERQIDPLAAVRRHAERHLLADCRRQSAGLGPASSLRALLDGAAIPMLGVLGFDDVADLEKTARTLHATLRQGRTVAALTVVPWNEPLDGFWRAAVVSARSRGADWSFLFNGVQVRLFSTRRLHTRRFVEFALDAALDDPSAAVALLTTLHADALTSDTGGGSALERMIALSLQQAVDVGRSLTSGVLTASGDLLNALVRRRPAPDVRLAFEQTLTMVYRVLFLLFAEARGLVPVWHPVYRESYSVDTLSAAAAHGHARGLWDALRAVSRLAHHGCQAGTLRVTPFNGRLFAPSRTPLVERRDLDDEAARRALLALSTQPAADGAGRERVAYRDLGVEQLGSVYETLLDYEPVTRAAGAVRVELRAGHGLRKSTGTFYTPQSIAQDLTRRTLEPLVAGRTPEEILALRVLDPAMGSGAFLVAACGYLAQAYEAALVEYGRCHGSDVGAGERAAIRRTIAERCVYGVDLNPMAVQLARLSLWLATLAADKPLGFLDHHLRVGNSVLGTWVALLRRPPRSVRRSDKQPLPLFEQEPLTDVLRTAIPARFELAAPGDTLDQVRAKERALAALDERSSPLSRWRRVADLWCATWFLDRLDNRSFGALSDFMLTGRSVLPERTAAAQAADVEAIASAHRFFHWELEFPEVFFSAGGDRLPRAGFDAVLGNPPWDMLRADQATPADGNGAVRRERQILRFTRDAGVYQSQSAGHANKYQLFVERAIALVKHDGRIGLVLPSGLATDQGSAPLRRLLLSQCDVDAIVGFENRRRIFPVHRSVRFLVLTATRGRATQELCCRFGQDDPSILEGLEPSDATLPIRLTPRLLNRLSGDDLAIPDFHHARDVVIAERVAALFPPLGSAEGWHARFGRELNAADDRAEFGAPERGVPVVEGKAILPFTVRLDRARWSIPSRRATALLGTRWERSRLAYRDVASATNRTTLIAALLPRGVVSTHTLYCLRTPLPIRAQHFLSGLFNSFVVNYLVRLRVTTHVTTAIVERLPVPLRGGAPAAFERIAALARILANRPHDERACALVNGLVARLYQLSQDEFEHVLATFPLVESTERDRALEAFVRLG